VNVGVEDLSNPEVEGMVEAFSTALDPSQSYVPPNFVQFPTVNHPPHAITSALRRSHTPVDPDLNETALMEIVNVDLAKMSHSSTQSIGCNNGIGGFH